MPTEQTTEDYRPYGAAAGASLPTLGVLEYLLKTRPEILRKMKAAPDWSLANGDIDVARAVKELKPGDFGVSGLQWYPKRGPGASPLTNFLVYGSGISSGGPGAHGQVVGRNLQVQPDWLRSPLTPKGLPDSEATRDLPFLMNERGELYSPEYARRYKDFHDVRDRYDQWEEYRKSVADGKPATKPSVPAPTKKELADFRRFATDDFQSPSTAYAGIDYGKHKERLRHTAQQLKKLKRGPALADAAKEKARLKKIDKMKRSLGYRARMFRSFLRDPNLKSFFGAQPDAARADNVRLIEDLAREMAGEANPADKLRITRMGELAQTFKQRGDAKSKQIAEMLERATVAPAAPAPARASTVFKPKAFEQFIPTLHHGGLQGTAQDPVLATLSELPGAARKSVTSLTGIGLSDLRKTLSENARELAADRKYVRENPDSIYRPLFGRPTSKKVLKHGLNSTDTVFDATAADGSRMRPAHMPGVAAYGPGGPRATTWARWTGGVDDARLHQGLVENVGQSYATTGATGAGAKEISGLSSLRRMLGIDNSDWGKVCWGNHCGSMPSQIYKRTGNFKSPLPHVDVLPNSFLADPNVEIIGIANKTRALKDFGRLSRARVASGLGAAGLMGAAGYGLTHLAGGAPKKIKPPMPVFDPRLVQAVKTLFPQQRS